MDNSFVKGEWSYTTTYHSPVLSVILKIWDKSSIKTKMCATPRAKFFKLYVVVRHGAFEQTRTSELRHIRRRCSLGFYCTTPGWRNWLVSYPLEMVTSLLSSTILWLFFYQHRIFVQSLLKASMPRQQFFCLLPKKCYRRVSLSNASAKLAPLAHLSIATLMCS